MWRGICVAVMYGAVAVAANFVNKYAVQIFPLPTTILLAQTLTTVMVLRLMSSLQIVRLPSIRALRVQQLAPLSMCRAIHAVLVLYSLAFLSIPMYNVLKRLTPVMVLTMKGLIDKRWPDNQTTSSVLVIVSGCLVAGVGDLSFDSQGYAIALVCAFSQATYILLAERASGAGNTASRKQHQSGPDLPELETKRAEVEQDLDLSQKQSVGHSTGVVHASLFLNAHAASSRPQASLAANGVGGLMATEGPRGNSSSSKTRLQAILARLYSVMDVSTCFPGAAEADDGTPLTTTELLYSICLISVPALAVVCIVTGEGAQAPAHLEKLRDVMGVTSFAVWVGTTAVTEGLLTGSVILCTSMNSALTTSIVGVLKGAVSSVLGFFLLGGVKFHAVNVAGISLNMAGGIWYSAVQYNKKKGSGGGGSGVLSA